MDVNCQLSNFRKQLESALQKFGKNLVHDCYLLKCCLLFPDLLKLVDNPKLVDHFLRIGKYPFVSANRPIHPNHFLYYLSSLLIIVFDPSSHLLNHNLSKRQTRMQSRYLSETKSILFEARLMILPVAISLDMAPFLNFFCDQYLEQLFADYKRFLELNCNVIFSNVDDANLRLLTKDIIMVDVRSYSPCAAILDVFAKGDIRVAFSLRNC